MPAINRLPQKQKSERMKRISRIFLSLTLVGFSFGFFACDEETVNALLSGELTEAEVIQGLKEALTVGTDTSVTTVSRVNGYFSDQAIKILLPDDVEQVLEDAKSVPGYSQLVEPLVNDLKADVVLSLNRAAEDAAPQAKDIFVDAITGMTIADGFNILNGSDTAATAYLRANTYSQLTSAFSPSISTSLAKPLVAGQSANQLYNSFVTEYNDVAGSFAGQLAGLEEITSTDLGTYVTQKGLDGLFLKVAEEEKDIRNDPLARVTDILERVFGNN